MEDLSQFCAEGATVQDRMVEVSDGVALRIVTFLPPVDKGNPSVLFVAGWITQMVAWKIVLREMTKDFIVIYIETREKISSCLKNGLEFSIPAIAGDIVTLVDKLNLRENRYVCFGSSLGATVIVESFHALKHKPHALVLIGPNAVFRVPITWKIIVTLFYPPAYALVKPFAKWYLKNFRLDVKTDLAQYEKYCSAIDSADPWKLKKAVLAVAKYKIWHRLESLNCPTLLIDASKDLLHEPENLRKISSMLPQVTKINLETNQATHSEKVVEEFRRYLAGLKLK
jgi:pimeloyl-ACP methyl ester carboxylesterase